MSPNAMKRTQTLIVTMPNIPVSIDLLKVEVAYLFLSVDIVVFTLMKKEPRSPPIIPKKIGP